MLARSLAIVGLVAIGGFGQAQVEFKQYASSDGRYKVLFPGAVKSERVKIDVGDKPLKVTVDSVELRGGTTFLVIYADAEEEVAKLPAGPRLDKVRDANKGPTGKVLSDKVLEVGPEKYPARDVLIERSTDCLRNRIVIAGNRVYQVMIQGPKDVVTSTSADRFLNSFEVTK